MASATSDLPGPLRARVREKARIPELMVVFVRSAAGRFAAGSESICYLFDEGKCHVRRTACAIGRYLDVYIGTYLRDLLRTFIPVYTVPIYYAVYTVLHCTSIYPCNLSTVRSTIYGCSSILYRIHFRLASSIFRVSVVGICS